MDGSHPKPLSQRVPIFALFGAHAVSMFGNVLTFVAVPWFVLQTTGSATQTGLVGASVTLGTVLAAFFGGPIVDRLGFKTTSVVADLASGVTVALIPLFYQTVGLAFWQLMVLVFLGSLLDAPGVTARQSLIPELSRMSGMPMERANSVFQAVQRLSYLVGPPLAGVLIVTIGAANVLWLDAATFAISAVVIALAIPSRAETVTQAAAEEGAAESNYLRDLAEGLGFILRNRLILSMGLLAVTLNFLGGPLFPVILPVYANAVYGSAVDLGLILAGYGAGAVVGTLLFGAVGHRLSRRATFFAALVLLASQFWVLAVTPSLLFSVAALTVMGLATGPLNPMIYTILQERTPARMLGRVFGVLTALAMASNPLGIVIAGYALEAVGLRAVLVVIAALYLTITLGALLIPGLRDMDAPKISDGDEATEEASTDLQQSPDPK